MARAVSQYSLAPAAAATRPAAARGPAVPVPGDPAASPGSASNASPPRSIMMEPRWACIAPARSRTNARAGSARTPPPPLVGLLAGAASAEGTRAQLADRASELGPGATF